MFRVLALCYSGRVLSFRGKLFASLTLLCCNSAIRVAGRIGGKWSLCSRWNNLLIASVSYSWEQKQLRIKNTKRFNKAGTTKDDLSSFRLSVRSYHQQSAIIIVKSFHSIAPLGLSFAPLSISSQARSLAQPVTHLYRQPAIRFPSPISQPLISSVFFHMEHCCFCWVTLLPTSSQ